MRIQHSLDVTAPPATVWDITIDVEALPELTPTMTSVTLLHPAPLAVGSTARVKQPAQRAKVWTVTELEPHKRFSWATRSVGLTMTASHDLAETPTGTRNTLTVEFEGRFVTVVGALIRPAIRKAIGTENTAIKTVAERANHLATDTTSSASTPAR